MLSPWTSFGAKGRAQAEPLHHLQSGLTVGRGLGVGEGHLAEVGGSEHLAAGIHPIRP
jgi:hypothetical protein